ncbi:Bug family tripartite tricarboxylate transporter substrate binding protein [Candidimonas nitroreducens]|uniref:LacI family transcriptional regulator n=1 Tax=Candidimonas nitroreducens TaxID=683354 RepID=A0A225MKE7_9BURK|nr:tripartite tricarboxylate transporter substrate binding protein [Candidimonas nitroreducens]OWT61724.1 hypothetical protein CEY11_07715 [Candidimonas nitroreducens]
MRRLITAGRLWVLAAAAVCAVSTAAAQAAWPEQTITLVAPFPPGGNADLLSRALGKDLSDALGQPVIVENKPGAGGMLGSRYVARAKADGYTLLMGAFSNVLNEFFYTKKLLDLRKDLAPVSQIVSIPNYVAVASNSKYKNLKDLLAGAKARPREITCGTSGVGTSSDLICALLNEMAGVAITRIPYKGGIPAITALMGGQITFIAANEALPYIKDKRIKGIAVTSGKRSPLAPELPSMAETVPGLEMESWYGVFAPAGTPKAVVDKLAAAISAAMKSPAMKKRLELIGAIPVGGSPAEFKTLISNDLDKWGKLVKPLNIRRD